MRERERRGGRSTMEVVVMVVAVVGMVVTGGVKDTAATPTVTIPRHHHHQVEPVGPTSMQANHVEDAYLDDALDDWLNNFETYTFMVKQDLDSHDDEGGEGGEEEGVEAGTTEEQEDVAEGQQDREEWSAPIAVSVGSKSLLDPHLDYLVTVESLVAEEGSIFLTLSKYNNQTGCGVGGFTVEAAMRTPPPRRPVARGESSSRSGGGGIEEQRNSSTTFIAFDLQHEGNMSLPDTSAWAEVSEDYWWARGRLAGGGMLSITFTPPECGCLALSTYYALPVGNLTLVVGPQAYPDELHALLCIDPLAVAPVQEEYDEEEEAEEDVGEYLQEPSALVAPRTTDASETEAEEEAETSPEEQPPVVTPRRRKGSRGERRKGKKSRRQMKRQRIRQAGRRQARRQQRLQQRQEGEEVEGEEGAAGDERARRRWKQKRRGKKVWRKIKRGRKGRRRIHGAKHHHLHHEEDGNGTSSENITDHHHHHHPHLLHGQNTSAAAQQEERLIDILLRDVPTENSTAEEEHEDQDAPAGEGSANGEAEVGAEGQEGEVDDAEAMTPRQRRKNRRQRKRMMRKERKKAHPPGVKFCCKQGVKHKKNILEFNSTSEASPAPCNSTGEVVSTFANHQFGIEVDACDHTYTKCCTGFTAEMWNTIKAKKMARRMERKQRRKSRRQGRKHRRQGERRMRKEMKKQSRHQDEAEEDAEAGIEEQGEGEAVVE